jgi:hypothetical protein
MAVAERIGFLPGFGWVAGHNWLETLLVCWLITPGMMYLIGLIGESRLLPWTPSTQFLSFVPGDLFLGAMLTALLMTAKRLPEEERFYNAAWWHILLLVMAVGVAIVITVGEYKDPNGYGHRAVLSPTKLYHNLVLYGGYGYIILATLIAIAVWLLSNWSWSATGLVALCLLPGAVWVSLIVLDQQASEEIKRDRVRYAHINDWSPIWSRR